MHGSKKILNRKGPLVSATSYDVGTIKKGNDGRKWIVQISSNKVKKWVPIPIKKDAIKYKNDTITYFDLDMIFPKLKGKIRKNGHLDITSGKIGIGELMFKIYPAKKGRYNIYHYNGSLIALHQTETFAGQIFKITKNVVGCDIGMFAFNDYKRIKPYIHKKGIKNFETFPDFNDNVFGTGKSFVGHTYIYESDLIENQDDKFADKKIPIAIFAQNKYGDGYFPFYRGRNAYWIMSYNVESIMMNLVKKQEK